MMRSATRVICVSEWEKGLVVRHFAGRARTSVIPNGVDVDQIREARPFELLPQEEIILSVGRLEAYKGADRLIGALPHLPPRYRLVLIGEGPARSTLESLVRKLNIQGRVRFLGSVERSELERWYRTAAVYVSFSAHEAFGLTLLEAAAAGSAVVASSIPAHREVARYAPHRQIRLVDRTVDSAGLAQAILEAHRDQDAWSPNPGRIPTWDGMARQLRLEYERILGSPG
jgi:glycosyltransferase involved in cell wall biosynthesis